MFPLLPRAISLFLVLLFAGSPAAAGDVVLSQVPPDPRMDGPAARAALDALLRATLEKHQLVGLSASVVAGNRIVWEAGYGLADIENRRPVRPDTIFYQGSVAKTITGTALVQLLDRKRISLDAAIDAWLPFKVRNPRFPDTPITFRMLLTHTASISDVQPGNNRMTFLNETRDPVTPVGEVLEAYLVPGGKYYSDRSFNDAAPGERFEYSNVSFSLIGYLVERISGLSFPEYCRKNLFGPLGMKETTWRIGDLKEGRFAYQYARDASSSSGLRKVAPFTWPGYMDGGLRTSGTEYDHFLIMLLNGGRYGRKQVVPQHVAALLLTPQRVPHLPRGNFLPNVDRSPIWSICSHGRRTIYQFNGFGTGFFTLVWLDSDAKAAGTLFMTGEAESMQALGASLLEVLDAMLQVAGESGPGGS
jgi:CubicO group peptidase (beta-lactamase class C family)